MEWALAKNIKHKLGQENAQERLPIILECGGGKIDQSSIMSRESKARS